MPEDTGDATALAELALRQQLFSRFPILQYFTYEHLPPRLQEISKPIGELAVQMALMLSQSSAGPEVSAGLRKLLEAKDCLVRARLT